MTHVPRVDVCLHPYPRSCRRSRHAAGITGKYVEARTCDVWTGPCFANAEMNLGGKHAVLGWKVDKGTIDSVTARRAGRGGRRRRQRHPRPEADRPGQGRPDRGCQGAQPPSADALVRLAKQQGGKPAAATSSPCRAPGRAEPSAGARTAVAPRLRPAPARIETRCLDGQHDKACGNESAFYPPLAQGREGQGRPSPSSTASPARASTRPGTTPAAAAPTSARSRFARTGWPWGTDGT